MNRTIDITNLKKNLYKINNSVIHDGLIVTVSSNYGSIVMISKEKYDSLIEALYFSSNPKIKDSIIDGLQANHSDCIDEENVKW